MSSRTEPLAQVAGACAVLRLVRAGTANTRADLAAITGLARSTIAQRVDTLLEHDLLVSDAGAASTGGRPAQLLSFNGRAGIVLAADVGATHARLAVCDLAGALLAEEAHAVDIAAGPGTVLDWLEAQLDRLARAVDGGGRVLAVGVGLPGPVEFATGVPIAPPIMPGWDGHPVGERLARRFGAPALIDNDANLMAVGERTRAWPDTADLLFVKVGTGIGAGLISHARLLRGAQGAAGDIGHIHVPDHDHVVCRCGNRGCLEAVAGGGALAAALAAQGLPAAGAGDVVRLFREGRPEAVAAIRSAGRQLGEALAAAVNAFNPAVIVIGGDLAEADEPLLAGVREVVYQRAVPLGTRSLRIVPSTLAERAGVIGAAVVATEHILAPETVDRMLSAAVLARGAAPARRRAG
jgi:predicted NBD/HSP70 family sugar kinase